MCRARFGGTESICINESKDMRSNAAPQRLRLSGAPRSRMVQSAASGISLFDNYERN